MQSLSQRRISLVIAVAIAAFNIFWSFSLSTVHHEKSISAQSLNSSAEYVAPLPFNATKSSMWKSEGKKVEGEHHEIPSRRRLFLGIFTKPDGDARLRNAIRKTYLREHQQPIKICSIAEIDDDCDVVYAFINQRGAKIDRRTKQEIDMIYLYEKKGSPLKSLYEYTSRSTSSRYDFVAHTSTEYVLCPGHLWSRELFDEIGATYTHPYVFMAQPEKVLGSEEMMVLSEGYSLVSTQLSKIILDNKYLSLAPQDGQLMGSLQKAVSWIDGVRNIPIQNGVVKAPPGNFGDMLIQTWDAYKDNDLVEYLDPVEEARIRENSRSILTPCRYGPRILLGIMTMLNNDLEVQRRHVIRETYLQFFNKEPPQSHRICALHTLLDAISDGNKGLLNECQLVYLFVVGGNPNGPKERVDYNETDPMVLSLNISEPDIIALNLQENMKEGKSQSYLKYGLTVIDEHIYFDYIAKTDADTMIYPDKLLNHEIVRFPSFPNNVRVYGGCNLVSRNEFGEIHGSMYFAGSLYLMSVDLARYVTSEKCDRKRLAVNSEDQSMGNFINTHAFPIHRIKMAYPPAGRQRRHGKDDVWDQSAARHPIKDLAEYRVAWDRYLTIVHSNLP